MVKIPNCIAHSISQLIDFSVDIVSKQESELYSCQLCDVSKALIHDYMRKKMEILTRISEIIPKLNFYYSDAEWTMGDEHKQTREHYRKDIGDFVSWVRSLDKFGEKVMNISDWTY